MPRREGMERKDLLKANARIFEDQGKALDQYAKKTVKVKFLYFDLLFNFYKSFLILYASCFV